MITIPDTLYGAIASRLWWEIEGREYRTFSIQDGPEADSQEIYATLCGTLRMNWEQTADADGGSMPRLREISGEDVRIITAQQGEECPNDFRFLFLRQWLLDIYG